MRVLSYEISELIEWSMDSVFGVKKKSSLRSLRANLAIIYNYVNYSALASACVKYVHFKDLATGFHT